MATAVQQQDQIDVFLDDSGNLVIQQYPGGNALEARSVTVAPVNVEMLIRAIRDAKREALEAKE